nr:hypothetical protein [Tanacetum cinerariifolium]
MGRREPVAIRRHARKKPTRIQRMMIRALNGFSFQTNLPSWKTTGFGNLSTVTALSSVVVADNYFTYYAIPPDQRLSLSVFYFTGDALSWYKHLSNNNLLSTWLEFIRALETRFGPSTYENHQATLFKFRQTSTIASYQTEFERISNCVTGLSNEALQNGFISGLRFEIQSEMALHNPTTLHQTYGLAKVIEDKLSSNRSRFNQSPRYFSNSTNNPLKSPFLTPTNPSTPHNNSTTAHTTTSGILPNPKPRTPLPFSRLSLEALQKRRAEGLCFRCPEKYHPGHVCTPPQFLHIAGNECESESDVIPDSGFFHIEDTSSEHTEIPTANEF